MKALWQLFRAGRIERQASDKLKYRGPSVACVGCGNNFAPTLMQPCYRCRITAEREAEEKVAEADPWCTCGHGDDQHGNTGITSPCNECDCIDALNSEVVEALRAYDAGESVSSDWLFEPGCDGKCARYECICPVEDEEDIDPERVEK